MNCRDARELLHAYADDELDVVHARDLDAHLGLCQRCDTALQSVRATKAAAAAPALYYKAPPQLLSNVMAATRAAAAAAGDSSARSPAPSRPPTARRPQPFRFAWGFGAGALAASVLLALGLLAYVEGRHDNKELAEVFTAHIRSLQPGHLTDVLSTDQHTVKPWLASRVDFSPPVRSMDTEGFHLAGARLDYLQGRTVAALVYQRGNHTINLFVWPGASGAESAETPASRDGFNTVHWTAAGMTFWAVSDLNADDLDRFARLYRAN